MKIKLVQWNIWYKEDPNNIASVIKQIDPDVACLQEIATFSPPVADVPQLISRIMDQADFNYKQAQRWDTGHGISSQGNAIFSKFPIEKSFFEFLQDESLNPTKYDEEGRIYVEITINIKGRLLSIGTAHLSYALRFTDSIAKEKEIAKLVSIISKKQDNYILAGDFNSLPESKVIKSIEKYLVNCGPDYEEKTWTTKPFDFDGFQEDKLNWRIDYIFASRGIEITNGQIIQTQYSDHLPILIEIEI